MTGSTKYIFVTGGVTSSPLGKGIISASLAWLLQARVLRHHPEAGPVHQRGPRHLNPYEHGECFVTEDGAETDLDLGALRALPGHAHEPGQQRDHRPDLHQNVIGKERRGEYLGKTVQVIPHITDDQAHIQELGRRASTTPAITGRAAPWATSSLPTWRPSASCAGRRARTAW